MSQIRSAFSIIVALAGPVALMLLVAVIASPLPEAEEAGRDDRAIPAHAGRAYLDDDGRIVHVALNVEQSTARTLLLHGSREKALARFHAFHAGSFNLESSELDSFRFIVHRQPSGTDGLGMS